VINQLTPKQAQELIQRGEVDVIDVREPSEWIGGHIPGARHVPLAQFRANPGSALPRDGVLFICAAGVRSQTAARVAEGLGFKRVYNLSGGTRSWASAGLPIVADANAA
jgi:rhodanese-related sulfurtransferase